MTRRRPPPPPKKPGVHVPRGAKKKQQPDDQARPSPGRSSDVQADFKKAKTLRGLPALSSGIFAVERPDLGELDLEPPPPPPPPPRRRGPARAKQRQQKQQKQQQRQQKQQKQQQPKQRFGPTRTSLGIPRQAPPGQQPPPPQRNTAPRPRTRTSLGFPRQLPPPPPTPARPPPPPQPSQRPAESERIACGVSEFGLALAELLERFEEVRGAILTDDEGNPVDFARRPAAIDALDLQIVGAQLERCVAPVDASCAKLGLAPQADFLIVEGAEATLISRTLMDGMFVFAAIVAPSEDLVVLSSSFCDLARKLTAMLNA